MNKGFNCTILEQARLLEKILKENNEIYSIISSLHKFNLPNSYVAAGGISQTVWNYQDKKPKSYGISDIDIIYYDDSDLSYESEAKVQAEIAIYFSSIGYKIDVTNEARTHLWYEQEFGIAIPQYTSSEDAINSWISATAIGVSYRDGEFCIYAPYGLNDMFGQVVRPNKSLASKEHFEYKSSKWKAKWENIKIIGW